jgi:hypothetical protein
MATLDRAQCPAVESIPGKVGGAWVLRGTQTPVNFPATRAQVDRLMAFVARSLDKAPAYSQAELPRKTHRAAIRFPFTAKPV